MFDFHYIWFDRFTNYVEYYVYMKSIANVSMEVNTPKTMEVELLLRTPEILDMEVKIPSSTMTRMGMRLPIRIEQVPSTYTDMMKYVVKGAKKVAKRQLGKCVKTLSALVLVYYNICGENRKDDLDSRPLRNI